MPSKRPAIRPPMLSSTCIVQIGEWVWSYSFGVNDPRYGETADFLSALPADRRQTNHWRIAIRMLDNAFREPAYSVARHLPRWCPSRPASDLIVRIGYTSDRWVRLQPIKPNNILKINGFGGGAPGSVFERPAEKVRARFLSLQRQNLAEFAEGTGLDSN